MAESITDLKVSRLLRNFGRHSLIVRSHAEGHDEHIVVEFYFGGQHPLLYLLRQCLGFFLYCFFQFEPCFVFVTDAADDEGGEEQQAGKADVAAQGL